MNGYVLAGGRSSRMGVDKARLPEDGWPVAVRLCERLEAAGLRASLIRRAPDGLPWLYPDGRPVPVVRELEGGRHPLRGVLTAVEHAGEPVFVVPCDVHQLSVASIRRLVAVQAMASHPLVGVFPAEVDRLRTWIREGRSARSFSRAPVVDLPPEDLVDRNQGGGPWPPERLLERVHSLSGVEAERVLRGELARLAARGVVVPEPTLYADGPGTGGHP